MIEQFPDVDALLHKLLDFFVHLPDFGAYPDELLDLIEQFPDVDGFPHKLLDFFVQLPHFGAYPDELLDLIEQFPDVDACSISYSIFSCSSPTLVRIPTNCST
ncbi:hypothetical protein J2Z45_004191 [Cohnella lubricantis]|uniref:hypothetical protein n=1 Tax=Cohnella lubricantis TaxID=2163172 RepID=UPI001AEAEE73|nr:hypothetical protein [Cohnella lubricantis]MBP2120571.1 hypothetical protein [Cohnella lubricantis]